MFFCHSLNNIGFLMEWKLICTINPFCDAAVAKPTVVEQHQTLRVNFWKDCWTYFLYFQHRPQKLFPFALALTNHDLDLQVLKILLSQTNSIFPWQKFCAFTSHSIMRTSTICNCCMYRRDKNLWKLYHTGNWYYLHCIFPLKICYLKESILGVALGRRQSLFKSRKVVSYFSRVVHILF